MSGGLYNMMFGVNNLAGVFLFMLGIDQTKVPRFRDCRLNKEGTEIIIHTRTGGRNRAFYDSEDSARENYPEDFEKGKEHPPGPWNEDLRKLSGFIRDVDSHDSTYADFYFKVPEKYAAAIKAGVAKTDTTTPEEKWQRLFEALKRG
jgi:hypothetical protein